MANSGDGDQEQRKQASMEDSNAMTIEFLRARLLSERSVSKTARQRANELSKRVSELEEQLKFVSLQRKKAEKATTDVLLILKNHGISDVSEGYDSNSDQEETLHEPGTNLMMKRDVPTNLEVRTGMEAFSSSELESSASFGRSLSWKNTNDSQPSLEKKKYMDPARTKYSFALNRSSVRRTGKSCRRIRRRDPRSIEEFQKDSTVEATCSRDLSNGSDSIADFLRDSTEFHNEKSGETLMLDSASESRNTNEHYISENDRDEDMESALRHQALLIVQFEEEEKAQREWEEKYTENDSGTQDSCDPSNHSDMTEEQVEIKSHGVSDAAGTLNSNNLEMKGKLLDARIGEELEVPKNFPSPPDAENGLLQDHQCSDVMTCKSPILESSFLVLKENNDKENSRKDTEAQCVSISCAMTHTIKISSNAEKILQSNVSPSNSSSNKLSVVPLETSKDLGSVLEVLQLAKSSLQQKITSRPHVAGETSTTLDTFKFPPSSPALFRLPTDYHFGATATPKHPGTDARSRFPYFSPEVSGDKLSSKPYLDPKNALSDGILFKFPSSSFTEIQTGAIPQRSPSQPRLVTGSPSNNVSNHAALYPNTVLLSVKDSYPFLPDSTFRLPLKEGILTSLSSSETSVPPIARFSSYNENFEPIHERVNNLL